MKLVPKTCPICGGELRRWCQRVSMVTRYGPRSARRWFLICAPCNVRVVLHQHQPLIAARAARGPRLEC